MPDPPAAPRLKRTMHAFGALMITLSCLSPTIGVFVVGSDVIREAGSGVIACFVAAAVLGIAMANVYAELVSAFPETGGEYTILGRTLGPSWGFVMLGMNLAGFTIAQALSGLGVASYLAVVAQGLPAVPTAVVLVVAVTLTAILNIRINAWITGAFLATEVASLAVLGVLGFLHPQRGIGEVVLHPVMLGAGGHGLVPTSLAVMGTAAAGAIYAFNGYGGVVSLGEELHEAPRRVAPVIFWALGLAALLQLGPMLSVMVGAPDLAALMRAEAPLPAVIQVLGGPVLSKLMSLAVALAVFNAMIAVSLMAGRQLFATGRDGVWTPRVNHAVTRLHPRFDSPWIATLVMGSVSVAWCFVPLAILVTVIASGTVTIYGALCLAAIAGRRNGSTDHAAYRIPFFPAAPLLALAALVGVVWTSLMDAKSGRPGLIANAVLIVACVLWYRLVIRPRGAWRHRSPNEVVVDTP